MAGPVDAKDIPSSNLADHEGASPVAVNRRASAARQQRRRHTGLVCSDPVDQQPLSSRPRFPAAADAAKTRHGRGAERPPGEHARGEIEHAAARSCHQAKSHQFAQTAREI